MNLDSGILTIKWNNRKKCQRLTVFDTMKKLSVTSVFSFFLINTRGFIYLKESESQRFLVCCLPSVSSKFSDSFDTCLSWTYWQVFLARRCFLVWCSCVWFSLWHNSHVLTLAAAWRRLPKHSRSQWSILAAAAAAATAAAASSSSISRSHTSRTTVCVSTSGKTMKNTFLFIRGGK